MPPPARRASPIRDHVPFWVATLIIGITGLVVQNEPIIGPLLDVLRRLGRRVPEDMSLVAICADDVAERQHREHLASRDQVRRWCVRRAEVAWVVRGRAGQVGAQAT